MLLTTAWKGLASARRRYICFAHTVAFWLWEHQGLGAGSKARARLCCPCSAQVIMVQEYAEAGPLAQARAAPHRGTLHSLLCFPKHWCTARTPPPASLHKPAAPPSSPAPALACSAARPSDAGALGAVLLSADCGGAGVPALAERGPRWAEVPKWGLGNAGSIDALACCSCSARITHLQAATHQRPVFPATLLPAAWPPGVQGTSSPTMCCCLGRGWSR